MSDPSTARKAEEVFLAMSDLPPERWESGIVRLCNGDSGLASEVRSLLGFHGQADKFLDAEELMAQSLVFGRARLPMDEELAPGTKIGVYTIRSLLGVGGMGSVYVAEQERPRRTVALKVIRRGLSTQSLLRRFEHEAEVLGRLQHPGIAQVFEAGTAPLIAPDGLSRESQPFIAMEYVRGLSLTKYCEERKLEMRERLQLMARVCDAVHHAHQRGVIHRDLKPANILVEDGGAPKVLDFGVARAADADLRVTTMQTSVGQLIGTLPYMSPEQVLGDPGEVDTRSDVYALGVVLYQVLTGRLPHDLGSRSIPEAARMIREDSPTKLSNVSKMFRGEVDTIVSTAIVKDKRRRYQSAAALGDDIRRYLAGEPIHAKQDSALYVLRKQLRRYKWAALAAIVGIVSLSAFAAYAGVQARRERHLAAEANRERASAVIARETADAARAEAEHARSRADALNARLHEELSFANVERGRLEGASGNTAFAEETLWRERFAQPELPATYWGLWELYQRFPCEWTSQGAAWSMVTTVSTDGSLAIIATGQALVLYETEKGTQVDVFRLLGANVTAVAITPDNRYAIAGLADGRIVRVDLQRGEDCERFTQYPSHPGGVKCLAISRDGKTLVTGGADRIVRVWDLATLRQTLWTSAFTDHVSCVAISPDGTLVGAGTRTLTDGVGLRVWRMSDLSIVQEFPGSAGSFFGVLCFSSDSTTLLAGRLERAFLAGDIASGRYKEYRTLAASIYAMVPNADNSGVLISLGDSIWQYDQKGLRPVSYFGKQRRAVVGLGLIGQSSAVLLTSDGTMRRIALNAEPALRRVSGFESWCFDANHSPDGNLLAVTSGDATVRIVRADTLQPVSTWRHPKLAAFRTRFARFMSDSRTIVTGAEDGVVRKIDAQTGMELTRFTVGGGEIFSVAISPDEETLAVGHADGIIRLWNLSECSYLGALPRLARRVEGLVFSKDGATLISSGLWDSVQLWDVASRQPISRLEMSACPWAVEFSPDGRLLVVTTQEGTIDVFDGTTYSRRAVLYGHGRLIPGLAFSPDGAMFATGGEDGIIKLWDTRSLRTLASLNPGNGEVVGMSFRPDGSGIAASTSQRFAPVYDFRSLDKYMIANEPFQRARAEAAAQVGATVPKQ